MGNKSFIFGIGSADQGALAELAIPWLSESYLGIVVLLRLARLSLAF